MPGTACVYVECPRDAWQGFSTVIPTEVKVAYVRSLLEAGFTRLDLGSFVSPRALPQTADTEALLAALTVPEGVELSCVVLNERGLERAAATRATHVGFPLSVSATFQQRNARQTLAEAWALLARLQAAAGAAGLGFTVYLSMGFGNPYGEPWRPEDTARALTRVRQSGVTRVVLADTVGSATPERLGAVLEAASLEGAAASELGLHLHAPPGRWQATVALALERGVRWFEGALGGLGGCPFAADERTGNLPTEAVLPFLRERGFAVAPVGAPLAALAAAARALRERYDLPQGGAA
jgi:hydroxymethylglutaryl-CoA lyase